MTRSSPMLALMPGTRQVPGTGANTGPRARRMKHEYRKSCSCPACVIHFQFADERVFAARHSAGYYAWLDHVWPAAACTRPVRLRGDIKHIDAATGELLRTIPTMGMPDGVIYKPCGNRRVTTCPGCAETYRRDAYQLIRAGLAGGKGITPEVATHPAVFVTFTAPSFGPVHARPVRQHTCQDKTRCTCQPEPCHPRRDAITCDHGRPAACFTRHRPDDPRLGQPLCPDCYDYAAHAVWNNQAGELWRRTKQAIERRLGQLARHRGIPPIRIPTGDGRDRLVSPIRVAHGKAAEYQARGAVHFHALLRLDGYDPRDPDTPLPPPPVITVTDLQDAATWAAQAISYRTAPHPAAPAGWTITWGTQTDVRVITMTGTGTVTDLAVASYLAKYSTKGTEPAGHASARITDDTIDLYANPRRHPPRTAHCTPAGASVTTATTPACAGGRTCSASAVTSSPKPAATPPPSATSEPPASPTGAARTPDPNTDPSAPPTTPTRRKPPSSSAPSPTPEPGGKPAATRSWPTPPPTRPANAAKPDANNSPTNTPRPWPARPHETVSRLLTIKRQNQTI